MKKMMMKSPGLRKGATGKPLGGSMGKMPGAEMPKEARMPFKKGGMAKKGKKC